MLQVIKNTYKAYFKEFHIWMLFILGLVVYSLGDNLLLDYVKEGKVGNWYNVMSMILGPIVYVVIEMMIISYAMSVKLGKSLDFIKKLILIVLLQLVAGYLMMAPVMVFGAVVQHHGLFDGWLPLALFVNIFLGIWLFAKLMVAIPLIMVGKKMKWKEFCQYSKASYGAWIYVALLVYFPYVASFYLISCNIAQVVISCMLSVVLTLFNVEYYKAKKL